MENLLGEKVVQMLLSFLQPKNALTQQHILMKIPVSTITQSQTCTDLSFKHPKDCLVFNTYFDKVLYKWNLLDIEMKNLASSGESKTTVCP